MRNLVLVLCFAAAVVNANLWQRGKSRQHKLSQKTSTTAPQLDATGSNAEASVFCFQQRSRRNHKDLYADPVDCHKYVQCSYVNATHVFGYQRRCASGLFWHAEVLSCLPEGNTPCIDRCSDPAVTGIGMMHRGVGCRQYFICANKASFGMCCPRKSRFNPITYLCDDDSSCKDNCMQSTPVAVPTTMAPLQQHKNTVCIDSFGRYVTAFANQPNAFLRTESDKATTEVQYCPSGHIFSLSTCRCVAENVPTTTASPFVRFVRRHAKLWLPFEGSTKDKSVNRFTTFLFGGAQYDATTGYGATAGSLSTNGGYLSIPGLKSFDTLNSGSWAAAFRCNDGCVRGAILSNNKDASSAEFTVQIYLSDVNTISARLLFWAPTDAITLTAEFNPWGGKDWTHVAVTYDGNVAEMYVNGKLASSENVPDGYLHVAHCAYFVGNDHALGSFDGNVDSILVTPFALTSDEVWSLYNGKVPANFL